MQRGGQAGLLLRIAMGRERFVTDPPGHVAMEPGYARGFCSRLFDAAGAGGVIRGLPGEPGRF